MGDAAGRRDIAKAHASLVPKEACARAQLRIRQCCTVWNKDVEVAVVLEIDERHAPTFHFEDNGRG